ncbi:MAG: insulinase family protein [Akkermansia sp.]
MKTFLLTSLMLAFMGGAVAMAEAPVSTAKALVLPNADNILKADPQMIVGKLENGLTYYIRPNAEPKGRMSLRLRVETGSLNETDEEQGISHFIEHLVFNGSKHFKRGDVMPAMQRHGLGLGGDANAYTSFDETVYMLDLPQLDDKTVDLAMTIMRDFGDGALIEESAVNAERGIITSEYKARDSADYRMTKDSMGFMLQGTKVADRFPIGTLDVINKAPRDIFANYYKKHYVPERMQLVLVGDFTVEQAKKWIEQYFGSMVKTQVAPLADWGKVKKDTQPTAKWITNKEVAMTKIELSNVIPHVAKPDTVQKRVDDLAFSLASAMIGKRLDKMTKKAECPFVEAGIDQDSLFNLADITMAQVNAAPEKWKAALSAVEQEIRRAVEHGFSVDEFNEVSKDLANGVEVSIQTWPTKKSDNLAGEITKSLEEENVFTAPQENKRVVDYALQTLTPEQCLQALRQAWDTKTMKVIVKSPLENPKGEEEVLAVLQESSQVPVQPIKQEVLKSFAYDQLGKAGKVVNRQEIADLGITTLTLSNGVKVNLKPTQFDKDIILLDLHIDGGKVSMPQGKEALAMFAPVVMNGGGLEEHSQEDIARLFAGKTVGVSFGIADEYFSLGGSTTSKDLEAQLKLMMAQMMHPGYRPEAEIQFQRMIPIIYSGMKYKPEGALALEALAYLFKGDKRFSMPSEKALMALTSNDVKAWVDAPLKNGFIEASVVGDFKVDEMIPVIERTLGTLPKRPDAPKQINQNELKVKMVDSSNPAKVFDYPSSIDRTFICSVWPVGDGLDQKRALRVSLLNSLLRERLFKGIREKMGEVYSPMVKMEMSRTYPGLGYILAVSPGVLRNQDAVATAIKEITSSFTSKPITQDELDRGKKPMINALEKDLRNNGYWQSLAGKAQTKPEELKFASGAIKELQSVTLDEINALGKEIFKPNQSIDFRILPNAVEKKTDQGNTPKKDVNKATVKTVAFNIQVKAIKTSNSGTSSDAPRKADYAVMISPETAKLPEWKAVADELVKKHQGVLLSLTDTASMTARLKATGARYLAIVARPEELDRVFVNTMHRMTRQLDADPYGDCIWGIVTGYTPDDAMRIARATEPLIIQRAGGTTNLDARRFSDSMCITDWGPFEVVEQHGYQKAEKQPLPEIEAGVVPKLVEFWKNSHPQLMVTSSHATQYNLEMPFEKGLIVSYGNRFQLLTMKQKPDYAQFLGGVLFQGKEEDLKNYVAKAELPVLPPDSSPKVWLAAGNCLFGDVKKSRNTMTVTALSAYGCNQVIGYTVPSWYGASGWGTLALFFGNHDKSSLSEAWYLNNQFILEKTLREFPALMEVNFNASDIESIQQKDPEFFKGLQKANYGVGKDQIGLVHDRDTMAFYGDPAWIARLDESHAKSPWTITWTSTSNPNEGLTVTANEDHKGNFAVWFPKRIDAKEAILTIGDQTIPIKDMGVLTNDFLLIRDLELKKGQATTIKLK